MRKPEKPETDILPIFIGYTRSFWFGILPIVLVLIDTLSSLSSNPDAIRPVSAALAYILGLFFVVTAEQIEAAMHALLPLYGLVIAQQRSGMSKGTVRPYSMDPKAK